MWKRWLPVRLPARLLAFALPFFAVNRLRWFKPLLGEWLMMLEVAVLPAVTVIVGSTVAEGEPPVADWSLVVLPSSRACATPAPVPAVKRAAPKAAATALRGFMLLPRLSSQGCES